MTTNETTNNTEIQKLKLETEIVFRCMSDARDWLADNYTTGDFTIYWDNFYGAYIYKAEPKISISEPQFGAT